MRGCIRGCAPLLLLLLVGGAVAWIWGADLPRWLSEWRASPPDTEVEATPALGEEAVDRMDALVSGAASEARFSGAHLESAVRYELPGYLPEGVSDPTVRVRDGEVTFGATVAREAIPNIPDLEGIRGFLPESVPVTLRGRIIALNGGDAGFVISRMDAAGVPIPNRFLGALVEALQPGAPGGDLPADIVRIPLPDGIDSIRVEGDEVVLVRAR